MVRRGLVRRIGAPVARKEYYSIGEVCAITRLRPHVLRYWETQFPALRPLKNRAGNRAYRAREIRLIQTIKHLLYSQGYTIEGARRLLGRRRGRGPGQASSPQREALLLEALRALREELLELIAILRGEVRRPEGVAGRRRR